MVPKNITKQKNAYTLNNIKYFNDLLAKGQKNHLVLASGYTFLIKKIREQS